MLIDNNKRRLINVYVRVMIGKDRIFKSGDVIVSGLGNIRIFTDDKFEGDAYKCLACYCTSGAPAGTDMRYARHATEKEKKLFFAALKKNGLCFNKKTIEISITENAPVEGLRNACVDWKADGPQPYKVVKKRVRPTLKEVNELKSGLENERRLHIHFAKECDQLEANIKVKDRKIDLLSKEKSELNAHLEDVRACNEKYGKEIKRLEEDNKALRDKNATLEQSNTLMEEELERQKRANIELSKFNDQYKEELAALRDRGFWRRLFNM